MGADRGGEAGGSDLDDLHEEAREVGNLARNGNPSSEGTGGEFQRPLQANSGRRPREKVTILRKKFSPPAQTYDALSYVDDDRLRQTARGAGKGSVHKDRIRTRGGPWLVLAGPVEWIDRDEVSPTGRLRTIPPPAAAPPPP